MGTVVGRYKIARNSERKVKADETQYMVISGDQHAGQSHIIKSGNIFFEKVEEFKYL